MPRPALSVTGRRERYRDNRGGDLVVVAFGRRYRFAAYYGTPPGSHIGLWRTHGGLSGSLQGLNLRIGRRVVGPALTVFVHTRALREDEYAG